MEVLSAPPKAGRPRSLKPADDADDVKLNVVMPPETMAAEEVYSYFTLLHMDGRSRRRPGQPEQLNRKLYSCSSCGRRFATSSNLSRHRQLHRAAAEGGGESCSLCGKLYLSASALQMHMFTHRPRHACGVCGKLFSRLWSVKCHLRSHTKERPYVCAHCDKKFADRANLRSHLQTHMRRMGDHCSSLLASCPICQKTFSLAVYLNKHLLYCLKEQMGVDVDECGSAAGVVADEVNVADLLDKVNVADLADEVNVGDFVDKGNVVGHADKVAVVDLVDKVHVVGLADEVNVVDLEDEVNVVDLEDEVNVVDLEDEVNVVT